METKIYLIYKDSMDDGVDILGYIEGTAEDAERYCEEYNAPLKDTCWRKAEWTELDKLNK